MSSSGLMGVVHGLDMLEMLMRLGACLIHKALSSLRSLHFLALERHPRLLMRELTNLEHMQQNKTSQ
jgi:hypothetical protein